MRPQIIAEIGQAHDGSLGHLHSYIDALKNTGVDAVKFQTHIADAESSNLEPFRVNFSYEDKTRFDYWKRMEFTFDQWVGIKEHCEQNNLIFISSPFSIAAVELLEKLNVGTYKIGSGEVSNLLMLNKIAKTNKNIIISSGLSSYTELDSTINYLKQFKNNISILQCTTEYPTQPKNIGLNVIKELKNRYQIPVGFSDHSGEIYPSIAATTLGAEILEFHVVFDKKQFGPDSKSSIEIRKIPDLIQAIEYISLANENPVDKSIYNKNTSKSIFEKSLAVNKNKKAGEFIQYEDLESKKPSNQGISAKDFEKIIGKKLKTNLNKWDFIKKDDIEL